MPEFKMFNNQPALIKKIAQQFRPLFLLIVAFSISACDVTSTPEDDFTDLDAPPVADTSPDASVKIENLLSEKIMIEIWSGDNIEYVPSVPEVKADFLKKITALEIDALSSQSFVMENPLDVLAIVGVDFNGRYEYLTKENILNVDNGTGLQIDAKGNLKAFDDNLCTANISTTEINNTLAILKLVENTANDVAGQWVNIEKISNPIDTLLHFTNQMLLGNTDLVFNELVNWTVVDGVYTHDETVNNTQLTLTTQFLWGAGFDGRTADEVINVNIHDPANYFTDLSTAIVGDKIVFTYSKASVLSPILGVPVDENPENGLGSFERNILDWLKDIKNNFSSLQWKMDLVANHTTASENIQTTLNFAGRPSFNISTDLLNLQLDISQNPLTLKLVSITDEPSNTGAIRSQKIFLKSWYLKFFPETSGAKGVVEFEVKDDPNFDFSAFMSYNSDTAVDARIFLTCILDESPIRY